MATRYRKELYGNSKDEKHLFLFDLHSPYEDRQLLRLIFNFIHDYKPDVLHLGGDFQDCEKISKFIRDPFNRMTFADELEHSRLLLEDIVQKVRKANKDCEVLFYCGNHEARLKKYIATHSEDLADLRVHDENILTIQYLYQLKELGVRWIDEMDTYNIHGVCLVEHGDVVRKESAFSARAMEDKRRMSGISGHVHRIGMFTRTSPVGTNFWIESGCLCDTNPKYVKEPNWQQGFVVGEYKKSNDVFYPTPILVQHHSFMYNGKLYSNLD